MRSQAAKIGLPRHDEQLAFRNPKSSPVPNLLSQACRVLFFGVVALAPLPFGSVEPIPIAVWCLLLALATPLAVTTEIPRRTALILAVVLAVAFAYALVVAAQTGVFGPLVPPDPIWRETSDLLRRPLSASAAMVYASPYYGLGPPIACGLSLALGALVGADRRHARGLLLVVAWSSAAYAIYGIFAAVFEPTTLLWRERRGYEGDVIGTFTYRNTAAAYFGCCAVIWLLLLCDLIRKLLPAGRVRGWDVYAEILFIARFDVGVRLAGGLVCLAALLMTGSRAGVVISLTGLVGAAIFFNRASLSLKPNPRRLRAAVAAAVGLLLLLEIVNGALNQRLLMSGLSDEGRFDTYQAILRMIFDHPWFGIGLGAFPDVYPTYRGIPPDLTGRWLLAHSTPIELAAEMGLPLATLVAGSMIAAIVVLAFGALKRRRDAVLPLVGATTTSIAMVHSCIDFPLQVPGFAIPLMAVLGACLSQAFRTSRRADS